MKKQVLLAILAISLMFGFTVDSNAGPKGHKGQGKHQNSTCFVDANNDGICDNFIDANNDGKCDSCKSTDCTGNCKTGKGKDANSSCKHEANKHNCGNNGTNKCTGEGLGNHKHKNCTNFIDADSNGVCDNFIDANNDGKCDSSKCTNEKSGKGNKHHNCQNKAENNSNLELFPNPTDNSTNIKFNLDKKANVIIDIYDVQGVKVKSVFNGEMNSGSQQIDYPLNDLQNGNYIIKLSVNGEQSSKIISVNKTK